MRYCALVTRDEYERRKRRLEEQLRAGVELLEAACQAQIRALDLVWMLQAEERGEAATWSAPARAKPEPLPQPDRPRRRSAPEVEADVRAAFGRLPEAFTRRDVCEVLGYEPDRAALYRILQTLTQEGVARVESAGEGQRATVYRKTGGHDSPAQG